MDSCSHLSARTTEKNTLMKLMIIRVQTDNGKWDSIEIFTLEHNKHYTLVLNLLIWNILCFRWTHSKSKWWWVMFKIYSLQPFNMHTHRYVHMILANIAGLQAKYKLCAVIFIEKVRQLITYIAEKVNHMLESVIRNVIIIHLQHHWHCQTHTHTFGMSLSFTRPLCHSFDLAFGV